MSAQPPKPNNRGDSVPTEEQNSLCQFLLSEEMCQRLFLYCRTICWSNQDAEEAVWETITLIWQKHGKDPDHLADPAKWVGQYLMFALNVSRHLRRQRHRQSKLGSGHELPRDVSALQSEERESDALGQLQKGLARLNPKDREFFCRRFFECGECTDDEFAEAHGMPSGTLKTRLRKIRLKLRDLVD